MKISNRENENFSLFYPKMSTAPSDITEFPSYMIEDRNDYMCRLFIEVLKMMGIRGYNTIPYQWILDYEMSNDSFIRRGELNKVTPLVDASVAGYISNFFFNFNW